MTNSRAEWRVTTGLLVLSAVPIIAGASRVAGLAGGAQVTAENARFFAVPLPVVVHIIGASLYCVLGALQFRTGFRRRRPRWHRITGRVLIPCGLAAALAGIWMTLYYPLPAHDGARFGILGSARLIFGAVMVVALVAGLRAILRRDIAAHRAWMIRAYAIALGAGTQVLTLLPWILLVGPTDVFTQAMLMIAAWVINIAVAEWIIRKRPRLRRRISTNVPTGAPAELAGTARTGTGP